MKTIIVGTGGHARTVLEILKYDRNLEIEGLIETNDIRDPLEKINGVPIIGTTNILEKLISKDVYAAIVAIGDNEVRREYYNILEKLGYVMINAIHPTSYIERNVKIGKGNVIGAQVIINANAKIGNNCIINTGALIEHENIIEDNVHIAPRSILAGRCKVKEGAFVGIGSVVKDKIVIGKNVIIGAGSVVTRDVTDYSVAYGIPAKEQRKIKDGKYE